MNKNIIISNFPKIAETDINDNITGLAVNNITVNSISSTGAINLSNSEVNLGLLSNISIGGGLPNQIIVATGDGNLVWDYNPAGTPGGANRNVQYNDDGEFAGSNNFSYDSDLGVVTIAQANIAAANVGNIYMTGNISNVDYLDLDTQSIAVSGVGRIKWNSSYATADLGLLNDVTLQIGQESHYYIKAGSAITNGRAVMFSDAQGDQIIGVHANSSIAGFRSRYIMGIATQDIAAGSFGYVTAFGRVSNINTFAYPEGSILYLKPNSDGELQTNEPDAPNPKVALAACLIQSNSPSAQNGRILVRPDEGYSLEDIQNVETTAASNNDVLVYNGTSNVWQHRPSVPVANIALTANTVTNAAQPNITSVGTLTNLTVSGILDAEYIAHAGSNITIGNGISFSQGSNTNIVKISGNAGTQTISFYNSSANIKAMGAGIAFNDAIQTDSTGIYPTVTGVKYLGGSAFRWGNLFATTGDISGNLTTGIINRTAYRSGEVIRKIALVQTGFNQGTSTIINSGTVVTAAYYLFTPTVAGSRIVIEYDSDWTAPGAALDRFNGVMKWDNSTINARQMAFDVISSGGLRGSVCIPMRGVYISPSTAQANIQMTFSRLAGDDTMTLTNSASFPASLIITEIAP